MRRRRPAGWALTVVLAATLFALGAAIFPTPASAESSLLGIPTGHGLPVLANVGVFFLDLKAFDDTKGEFEATTDVRLRWSDPRLSFPLGETPRNYKEYRGKAAEEQIATIWTPRVDVVNRREAGEGMGRRLRIHADGRVELMTRTTARYKVRVDAQSFPFDRQHLMIDLLVREDTVDEVLLRFDKDDVVFSSAARGLALDGWLPGLVDLDSDVVPGWNGDRYSRVTASLFVDRDPTTGLTPIFIPLVASLLIPLLAIWMNRPTEDGFEIPAFELANMGIGGLFSVIALSFAVSSSYSVVAGNDNTVTRLFALNYATLAFSLSVIVTFFRFNLPRRLFGVHVHREMYRFLVWAMPVLTLGTSIAFLLAAAA